MRLGGRGAVGGTISRRKKAVTVSYKNKAFIVYMIFLRNESIIYSFSRNANTNVKNYMIFHEIERFLRMDLYFCFFVTQTPRAFFFFFRQHTKTLCHKHGDWQKTCSLFIFAAWLPINLFALGTAAGKTTSCVKRNLHRCLSISASSVSLGGWGNGKLIV